MEEQNYPALYQRANSASLTAQHRYLFYIRFYSFMFIVSTGLSVYGLKDKTVASIAAIIIVLSIFISLWMFFSKDVEIWYRARAVAESVKTTAWRFMMRADPFGGRGNDALVNSNFCKRLMLLLNEHNDLAYTLSGGNIPINQITEAMCNIRKIPLMNRVEYYKQHRLHEQFEWYKKKSTYNKTQGMIWTCIFVFCQIIALVLLILRLNSPNLTYFPSELLLVSASGVLTWMQVKRFRELASAYSLTSLELGLISNSNTKIDSEEDFSQFVMDTENAFSREHTKWLARKDVI